ncbi:lipopolysaccharide core heptose(I) kinase RfaP [Escherichia coli]
MNPLTRTSFIITEDPTPTISLEDYCADWATNPPDVRVKRMLIKRVATMVRDMHAAGINHRDCYICHFLLHLPFSGKEEELKISVIDLHRAQLARVFHVVGAIKIYWALFFFDEYRPTSGYCGFTEVYFAAPLKDILKLEQGLLSQARSKSHKNQGKERFENRCNP